ncbi:Retrotransposon gag domain, partial [Sesbania bispinosa]
MAPKTKTPARREASDESASQPCDLLQRGRGRGRSRGRRDVNAGRHGSAAGVANVEVVQQLVGVVAEQQQGNQQQNLDGQQGVRQLDQQPGAMTGGIEVTLAEFMKLKPPTFSGSNVNEDPQQFIDGLERLWRALGCSDIQDVELASFQLEGVAYDWFDTVTHGRLVGSPLLAWGEFSRLFMARFLPESVRDGLAHEFERLEQTEGMSVSEYSARFTQLSRHAPYPITEEILSSGRRRKEAVAEILPRNNGLRDCRVVIPVLVWDQCPIIRCNRERYHRGLVLVGSLLAHRRVVDQIKGNLHGPPFHNDILERDCPVVVTRPSSSHASAPAALASFQDPSAPVRQFGGSSGRGILPICSRDAHVLFDPGATHSFVSLSFSTQLGKSPSSLDDTLAVTTPIGEILLVDCVYRSCVVSIEGKELFSNQIALAMVDFDVILGMDWLASHYATLDCHNKVVKFEMPGESAFSFQGEKGWAPHNLISALAASKLLRKGCQGYLALVRDIQAVK